MNFPPPVSAHVRQEELAAAADACPVCPTGAPSTLSSSSWDTASCPLGHTVSRRAPPATPPRLLPTTHIPISDFCGGSGGSWFSTLFSLPFAGARRPSRRCPSARRSSPAPRASAAGGRWCAPLTPTSAPRKRTRTVCRPALSRPPPSAPPPQLAPLDPRLLAPPDTDAGAPSARLPAPPACPACGGPLEAVLGPAPRLGGAAGPFAAAGRRGAPGAAAAAV